MSTLNVPNHTGAANDDAIAAIAAGQHGLVSRTQALSAGFTSPMIKYRVKTGRWHLALRNVYRIAGAPVTWRQRAMAACLFLGKGASISHRSAAILSRVGESKPGIVAITAPRNRNRRGPRGIRIYSSEVPIVREDITAIEGIPVTKPARTLIDLATTEPRDIVERCLDDALRKRIVSLAFLDTWLAEPARMKLRGARIIRHLLDERVAHGVTDSEAESKLLRFMKKRKLPLPMLQYRIRHAGIFPGKVDFAYVEERVAVEMDGFTWHDTRARFDAERARGNRLENAGWRVLRVGTAHLDQRPDEVVEWIKRALRERPERPSTG